MQAERRVARSCNEQRPTTETGPGLKTGSGSAGPNGPDAARSADALCQAGRWQAFAYPSRTEERQSFMRGGVAAPAAW
jgi:hypothetical protein